MSVIASEYSIIDFYWRRSSLRCYWLFVFYFLFFFFDGFGFGFWPVSMVENGRFDWTAAKWRQMTQFSASKMPSVDVVDRNGAEFIRISPKVEPKSNQQTHKKKWNGNWYRNWTIISSKLVKIANFFSVEDRRNEVTRNWAEIGLKIDRNFGDDDQFFSVFNCDRIWANLSPKLRQKWRGIGWKWAKIQLKSNEKSSKIWP